MVILTYIASSYSGMPTTDYWYVPVAASSIPCQLATSTTAHPASERFKLVPPTKSARLQHDLEPLAQLDSDPWPPAPTSLSPAMTPDFRHSFVLDWCHLLPAILVINLHYSRLNFYFPPLKLGSNQATSLSKECFTQSDLVVMGRFAPPMLVLLAHPLSN